MSRPRLGIDIDDVLSQTNVFALQKIKTQHAIEWQYENIIDHSWETLPGFPLDAETMFKFWDLLVQGDDATENILPVEGSIEAVATLAIHYELYAITARKESTQLATEIWLKKHFKNAFNSITFVG